MAPSLSSRWTNDPEYRNLLNYIIERTKNVESPMYIQSLGREFKEKSGAPQSVVCLGNRIEALRTWIQSSEHIDTNTKVKVLFALSAGVHVYFLGDLELGGDHSQAAKNRTAQLDSKINYRKLISDYFENKNNVDIIPKKKKEKEMWNLIGFITRKCANVDSPLNIQLLATDFINHFEKSRSAETIRTRIKEYCNEIQGMESLDTHSKVKQLFGLKATLDSNFLKQLRKDAFVEVDHKNRITKYTANDNSLTLRGSLWESSNTNPKRIMKNKVKGVVKKSDYEVLNDGRDEYSSVELGSELDTDDKAGNIEMSIEDDFEYDLSSPTAPQSSKRKTDTTGSSSSKRTRPSSNDSMRPNEPDDYDTNYSIDDGVKLEPFCGSIQENLNEIEGDEDIQQVQKPLQNLNEHNQIEEVSIKIEVEEPAEVKPETSHTSKFKFFEAMQLLIICLGTPCLSWIKLKIHQKIQKLEKYDEAILNDEISLIIDLLVSQIIDHSLVNPSKTAESVNLSNFLCYLKAAILNSKMSGVEGLMKNISELIEESQNKRIPAEEVENALLATLDIDNF